VTVWSAWADGELQGVRDAGQWRQVRSFDAHGPSGTLDGRPVVSFASNDYLGLAAHPVVQAGAAAALEQWGSGAGASRLIVGSRPVHHDLEAELALWKGTERALVFPTGFAANLGVLGVLGGPDVTIFSDELNHASIIDGCRLSRASVVPYRHCDLEQLADLLAAAPGRAVVVTDSVFSMDGDVAPVDDLGVLCAEHGALLVLDEAHAVLGPDAPAQVEGLDLLRVGTLSKALGALGGFVAGTSAFVDLLINRARPFIFTTALTPADAGAALAAVRICQTDEGEALRTRLRQVIDRVQPGAPSPIIPIVLGAEDMAVAAAEALLGRGVLVPAIRPPTVAPGTCRLRVALSSAHTDAMLDDLLAGLTAIGALPEELAGAPA
jgi:8-amino-7-oxononanoate synthase